MKLRVAFHSIGIVFRSSIAAIVNPYLMPRSCRDRLPHQVMLHVNLLEAVLQYQSIQCGCATMHSICFMQVASSNDDKLAGPAAVFR